MSPILRTERRSGSSPYRSFGASIRSCGSTSGSGSSTGTWRSKATSTSERGRAYTKKIQELAPVDLPAFIEAERYAAEEVQKKREQEEFVQDVREDLGRLGVRREGRPIR